MPPTKWKDEDSWRAYGLENGYDKLNPKKVYDIDGGWLAKGYERGWYKDFEFQRKRKSNPFHTENIWRQYGLDNEYDKMDHKDVEDIDKIWVSKGYREKWKFNFLNKSIPFETKLAAMAIYLFNHKVSLREISDKYKIHDVTVWKWSRNKDILDEIAKRSGLNYKEIIFLIDRKIRTPFETRLATVAIYLFGDKSSIEIANKYKLTYSTILTWYRDREILDEISKRSGLSLDEIIEIRDRKINKNRHNIHQYETKLSAAENYLFGDRKIKDISEMHGIAPASILRWLKDDEILNKISEKHGKPYKEIIEIRDKKIKSNTMDTPFETKLAAAATYLFTNKRGNEIAKKYKNRSNSISRWYKDPEILSEISRRSGRTLEDIERMRDIKTCRIDTFDDSPKIRHLMQHTELSSAELASILSATDELSGHPYEDIQRRLNSVPRLNIGPLSMSNGEGNYDAVSLAEELAEVAPEVYQDDDVTRLIVKKLEQHYERLYPETKHDPESETILLDLIRSDMERIMQKIGGKYEKP